MLESLPVAIRKHQAEHKMPIIDDARTAVRGALCNVLNGLEAIDRFAVNLGLPNDAPSDFPGTPFGNIVNSGQGLFCDRLPQPLFLFTGGQCVCVQYDTQVTVERPGFSNSTSGNVRVFGPITDLRIREFQPPGQSGTSKAVEALCRGTVSCLDEPQYVTYIETPDEVVNPSFTYIQRVDGLPDDCEREPPEPLPEPDRTQPVTINNINGAVIFAFPILNINGDLQVGFTLEVGELKLSGTVELNTGDINFNFGGQPTDPDAPTVPTPDGVPPDADFDDPEPEKKANIIGVIVVSTSLGSNAATEVPKKFMPDLYIPRMADVSFQIRIKNKTHWTSDLPVKSKNAYIPCPGEIDAIDVVVEPQPGWQVFATPVRGIVPSNQVVLI